MRLGSNPEVPPDENDEDDEESSPSKSRSPHDTDIESAIDEIQQESH